mgnify:CR=1 FL=1
MRVRKARPEDIPRAVQLARSLGLDYPGMEADPLWVAGEAAEIVGLVALKKQTDCLELCALGVDPRFREKGLGKALVEALMEEAPADVHLATVSPGFFEACGFERAADVPATFAAKRKTAWCEGCPRERCTIMLRTKP